MRKLFSIHQIVLLFFILTALIACKKDQEDISPSADESRTPEQVQQKLGKKWEVNSTASHNAKIAGAAEYTWFEFFPADDKYIVFTEGDSHYGTYSINTSGDTITLHDFGKIAILRLNDTAFIFSLKREDETTFNIIFTTAAAPTVPSSSATDLLCKKMWTINWQVPEGGDTIYYDGSDDLITKIEVCFSTNGTYWVHQEGLVNTDVIKYWKWDDVNETKIALSTTEDFSSNNSLLIINKLTENEWDYQYPATTYGSASR